MAVLEREIVNRRMPSRCKYSNDEITQDESRQQCMNAMSENETICNKISDSHPRKFK